MNPDDMLQNVEVRAKKKGFYSFLYSNTSNSTKFTFILQLIAYKGHDCQEIYRFGYFDIG